jgi:16S rRNA (guanine966-N2)-methyltransferase
MRVLDLFAGSGSLGLEALSRGADHVTFVDCSRAAAAVIAENLGKTGLTSRGRIITADAGRALHELAQARERFDLVFVDAPFKADTSEQVLALLEKLDLVLPDRWVVVRQFHRAPALTSPAFEPVSVATLGDHRIALYRRLGSPEVSGTPSHG